MTNLSKKYKDLSPEETINNIKTFFQLKNFTIFCTEYENEYNIFWCNLSLKFNNQIIMKASGKGLTKTYALASGYAELYERYCSKQFIVTNPFLLSHLKVSHSGLTEEELFSDNNVVNFYNNFFNSKTEFIKYLQLTTTKQIPATIFTKISNSEERRFNLSLVIKFTSSTGCAAGNSVEEALVQGISEWCERYVISQLISQRPEKFYTINSQILSQELQDKLNLIQDKIYIIDLSYNYNLPVCALLLYNTATCRYYYSYGAAPTFNIAVERCLTELFQSIKSLNNNKLQQPFNSVINNIIIKSTTSTFTRTFCPFELLNFEEKDNYNTNIFLSDSEYTNIDLLNHYKSIIPIDLYYTDLSLTENIKTIKIYSPDIDFFNNVFSVKKLINKDKMKYYNLFINVYDFFDEILNHDYQDINKIVNYLNIFKTLTQKDLLVLETFFTKTDLMNPYYYNEGYWFNDFINFLQTEKINILFETQYFTAYEYLKSGYSLEEVYKILHGQIPLDELKFCYLIEYIVLQTFIKRTNILYKRRIYEGI